jgi:hypothetical protein
MKLPDHLVDRRPAEEFRFFALAGLLEKFVVPAEESFQAAGKARF